MEYGSVRSFGLRISDVVWMYNVVRAVLLGKRPLLRWTGLGRRVFADTLAPQAVAGDMPWRKKLRCTCRLLV